MELHRFLLIASICSCLCTTTTAWTFTTISTASTRITSTSTTRLYAKEAKGAAKKAKAKAAPEPEPTTAATTAATATTPNHKKKKTFTEPIRPHIELDNNDRRPGAILESEADLIRKEEIFQEMASGQRIYPDWMSDYGEMLSDLEAVYDTLDDDALDAEKLANWNIFDLKSKFYYEYDPSKGDMDINKIFPPDRRYIQELEKDDDGVEIGYDPLFGSPHPFDHRTVVGTVESYMIEDETKNDDMLTPSFYPGDLEIPLNHNIRLFRRSLDIIENYTDPFYTQQEVPSNVLRWYGYPEPMAYPKKNYTNNRFTANRTDFDAMPPHQARKMAVQYARSKNCEWLPPHVAYDFHTTQRAPYEKYSTLIGTTKHGHIDPDLLEQIQPALKVLQNVVELLSIEDNIYRFKYHGLIKNKYGMSCYAQTLLDDCGVTVDNVVFETGFRKRDFAYDGGFHWYGPY